MNQLDKLLIKAKIATGAICGPLYVAIISREDPLWVAEGHLQYGADGCSPTIERSTHASEEDAIEAIHALAEKHPNINDATIVILDDV